MKRALVAVLGALAAVTTAAEERIADIRQGTNISLALSPDGTTLVVDLLGQLWSLPASGGGARPLTSVNERARNPRFSPDGTRVVYQRRRGEQWDLWLLDLETGAERPLVTSPYDEREPDFTPDGRSVVFASNPTGCYCLWSVSIEDGVETQLTEEPGTASYPTVSEQGVVAYVLERPGESSLRTLAPDGTGAVLHTSMRRLFAPSWRPGAGVLVFGEQDSALRSRLQLLVLGQPRALKAASGSEDIFPTRVAWRSAAEFVYAADGQLWRRGIATPTREPVHLIAAVAVTTPDVEAVALAEPGVRTARGINGLARSRDGRAAVFTALGDLWLAERGEPRRLTDDAFVDLDPTFVPDGESVVFTSERTGQLELWRLSLRERRLTQLTFGALAPRHAAVRPDGDVVAYLELASLEPGAASVVKTLDLHRSATSTVATNVVAPTALDWSEDGRTLVLRARAADRAGGAGLRLDLEKGEADEPRVPAVEQPAVRWQQPAPPADYVVEIGRLFDGIRGTYRRHVDLHVRGGRIAAIVGRGVLPPSGRVVDARDATVIPGLIDVHAHMSSIVGERLGRAWLAYGVTTVRELASAAGEALERAEAWASGRTPGPRLLISSAMPVPDAPAIVRAYPGIANGLAHSLPRQSREIGVPPWEGRDVPARLPPLVARSLTELELSPSFAVYQDGVSRLVAAETTFVTGLAALSGLDGWPRPSARSDSAYAALFTPSERAVWERPDTLGEAVPHLEPTIARLVRAGGRVAVGSDAPAVPYGLGVHLELALLAQAGIANDQVLRMATAVGALALGIERDVGTLEEGKLADFVVLDGDPLTYIADTLRISAVVKGGVWYDRAELTAAP
jgi:dipeptidyl aminopeptidase/acylaminoacyl peptidase